MSTDTQDSAAVETAKAVKADSQTPTLAKDSPETDQEEGDSEKDNDSSSTTDDSETAKEDPEILLIKATTLKEEGNNYFKEKDYEKASRAYRRGTNALKPLNHQNTGDEQVKALLISLQTNLSMMCFKQEKYKQSCNVATSVLKIDSANVKALYRRAVALRKLGDHEEARNDLKEALKKDPNNNAVKKELVSLKKLMEDAKKAQKKGLQKAFSKGGGLLYDDKEEEKRRKAQEAKEKKAREEELVKKRKAEWENECVSRMAKGEAAITFEDWEKQRNETEKAEEKRKQEERKKARAAARAAAKDESESDDDDELTEKEMAQLRGYKKTSDGRTTSYFNREQSAHEKSLIGDIAPKKLDAVAPATPSSDGGKGNPSAWNQAGTTWEEKDTTEWCRGRLRSRLMEAKSITDSLAAVVTDVKDMTGDASVAIASGKKRYIFDFHCSVSFEIRDPDTDDVLGSGTLKLPDICSTHHHELEVGWGGWKKRPSSENDAVDCRTTLVSQVRETVKLFVDDFNNMY